MFEQFIEWNCLSIEIKHGIFHLNILVLIWNGQKTFSLFLCFWCSICAVLSEQLHLYNLFLFHSAIKWKLNVYHLSACKSFQVFRMFSTYKLTVLFFIYKISSIDLLFPRAIYQNAYVYVCFNEKNLLKCHEFFKLQK